jgi:hypothetical protein
MRISVDNLKEIPRNEWPYNPDTGNHKIIKAYKNSEVAVLEYHLTIWWGFRRVKIRHLGIRTFREVMLNRFYDLMSVKNQICGEDCVAVQVYPKESEIMDDANMVHLFVFPPGFRVPLTLQRNW